ncbi:DUF4912 domain-containing protein [Heliorestis convoluta]|uniref:DUF4912 domain-containing protein n=1 Tax=Heliorestis convoluta TaxID=356322 RepID=A0A5Q2N1Y1_9FIRM|nr:DUF4912 domain-containing protein [Heliorestis convoluta]QGG47839.1 hypothetical protein FTV88_1741 [Heliorestis convoluta]
MGKLPRSYGQNCMGVLVQDLFHIYVYWEITAETREQVLTSRNLDVESPCQIRVQQLMGDSTNLDWQSVYQAELPFGADHWYLSGLVPGTIYRIQIGIQDGEEFKVLLSSEQVHMPPAQSGHRRSWGRAHSIIGGVTPVEVIVPVEEKIETYSSTDLVAEPATAERSA